MEFQNRMHDVDSIKLTEWAQTDTAAAAEAQLGQVVVWRLGLGPWSPSTLRSAHSPPNSIESGPGLAHLNVCTTATVRGHAVRQCLRLYFWCSSGARARWCVGWRKVNPPRPTSPGLPPLLSKPTQKVKQGREQRLGQGAPVGNMGIETRTSLQKERHGY